MNRTFSIQSNQVTGAGVEQSYGSSTIMTNRNNHHHCRRLFCCELPSNYLLIKYTLILWLIIGIVIYLLDIFLFHVSSSIKELINLPSDLIFLMAICNNFSLIISIVYELRPLLIISILIDCILLVAIPALIVEVGPNLLTYSSLMLSIILAIYYGVLYMRHPLFYIDNDDDHHYNVIMIGRDRSNNLPYDYLSTMAESTRFSFNSPPPPPSSSHRLQPLQSSTNDIISSTQPRLSCQF